MLLVVNSHYKNAIASKLCFLTLVFDITRVITSKKIEGLVVEAD